jgi:hypothetical protein
LLVSGRAEAEPIGQSAVVLREQSNGGVDEQAIRLVASLKASSLEKKLLFGRNLPAEAVLAFSPILSMSMEISEDAPRALEKSR